MDENQKEKTWLRRTKREKEKRNRQKLEVVVEVVVVVEEVAVENRNSEIQFANSKSSLFESHTTRQHSTTEQNETKLKGRHTTQIYTQREPLKEG